MRDVESLSPAERGFVLGAALAGGGTDALAGDEADRCGEALAALRDLPRGTRAGRLARLAADALRPVPVGVERVESGRLIEALAPHGPELVAALVAGLALPIVAAGEAVVAAGGRRLADVSPAVMDVEALADLRRAVFGPLGGA